MRHRWQRILGIALAAILCLQASIAVAHCLRFLPSTGLLGPATICTAEGMVAPGDSSEEERHSGGPTAHGGGACFACHGLPNVVAPEAHDLTEPVAWQRVCSVSVTESSPLVGARAPPYAPTGPPRLS
jgi:hypothetical protein